jgi:TctA family transporter
MTKMLDVIGLILVAIMSLGFMGILRPTIEPGLSPLFWGCAGATLLIIIYRKKKRKQEESES